MTEDNERLARTTCAVLDYDHMKDTLMKIFGDPGKTDGNSTNVPIKEEYFYSKL